MQNATQPNYAGRRVLIYAPMMASIGGIERHLCLLAQACVRVGMRVTFVTTSNSLNESARRELLEAGIEFLEQPAARGVASQRAKAGWLLRTLPRLRQTKWDVIYTNGQSVLAMIVWLAARRGTRILHHHHTSADPAEQRTWHPAYRLAMRLAPELMAVSDAPRRALEAALGRKNVRCVYCLTPRIPGLEQISEKPVAAGEPLKFGFIGRLVPEKGIDEVCRLSTRPALAGIEWHLWGQGDAYGAEHFTKFPRVTWHGLYGSLENYARILQDLDALVLYSTHSEGLPLTLMEAMAAGLPWIATDRGGTRELAASAQNCVVIPAAAPPAEIERLTTEFAARIRGGGTSRIAQRQVYEERFAPEKIAARWFEIFNGAL